MRARRWLVAAVVACAGARPLDQSPFGGVAGVVVDADTGKPLPTALVRFRGKDGVHRGALTDLAGEFIFGPVEPSTLNFTLR